MRGSPAPYSTLHKGSGAPGALTRLPLPHFPYPKEGLPDRQRHQAKNSSVQAPSSPCSSPSSFPREPRCPGCLQTLPPSLPKLENPEIWVLVLSHRTPLTW